MVIGTKVSGKITKEMGMEWKLIQMGIHTRDIGKIIWEVDKENCHLVIKLCTKVNGEKMSLMVKVHCNCQTVTAMKANSKTTNEVAMVH